MTFACPQYLVETAWLEAHLNDPDLRILDCSVFFSTDANGVRLESGRDAWTQSHIPGSGFADLMQDLSDTVYDGSLLEWAADPTLPMETV